MVRGKRIAPMNDISPGLLSVMGDRFVAGIKWIKWIHTAKTQARKALNI